MSKNVVEDQKVGHHAVVPDSGDDPFLTHITECHRTVYSAIMCHTLHHNYHVKELACFDIAD